MDLVFRDIQVKIDKNEILRKVSGIAKKGEMLAVMGPSGKFKYNLQKKKKKIKKKQKKNQVSKVQYIRFDKEHQ